MPPPRLSWLLVLLPLWLVISGGIAIWYFFHLEKQQALVEQQRFVQSVSTTLLEDDLRKIVEVIGERNTSSTTAAANLSRTASMIEGLLGPSNSGYAVKKHTGPGNWPILQVSLTGKTIQSPAVWVVTSYDSQARSRGAEANATGLAATLSAAQALAGDKPQRSVHFIFLPHSNDLGSPVIQTAEKFAELSRTNQAPHTVLCVEAMGTGDTLCLSSRDTSARPLDQIHGLGMVIAADTMQEDETDLASRLCKLNLPAVRVATRAQLMPGEVDNRMPSAPTVAASAGRLIELIRRCAAN